MRYYDNNNNNMLQLSHIVTNNSRQQQSNEIFNYYLHRIKSIPRKHNSYRYIQVLLGTNRTAVFIYTE